MDNVLYDGIDYDKGLKNCMGSTEFYNKILHMFLDDACFSHAEAAFSEGRQRRLFECMHELKGISGDIGLTELYSAVVPLVELLRNGEAPSDEVKRLFADVKRAYDHSYQGVKDLLADSEK